MTEQIVQPAEPRHRSFADGSSLRLIIPSRKRWLYIVFTSIWLVGWGIFELIVLAILTGMTFAGISNPESNLFIGGSGFLLLWVIGWTVAGAFVLFTLLWQLGGRETIRIDQTGITIRKGIFALGIDKKYSEEHLLDLRITPFVPSAYGWGRSMSHYGFVGGFLAFDYGSKTIHFGAGADEAEAKQVYQKIIEHYPKYADASS